MTSALKLKIIHFDSMENSVSQAEYSTDDVIFVDEDGTNAHSKCAAYVKDLDINMYLGWNNDVYPKVTVESVFLR